MTAMKKLLASAALLALSACASWSEREQDQQACSDCTVAIRAGLLGRFTASPDKLKFDHAKPVEIKWELDPNSNLSFDPDPVGRPRDRVAFVNFRFGTHSDFIHCGLDKSSVNSKIFSCQIRPNAGDIDADYSAAFSNGSTQFHLDPTVANTNGFHGYGGAKVPAPKINPPPPSPPVLCETSTCSIKVPTVEGAADPTNLLLTVQGQLVVIVWSAPAGASFDITPGAGDPDGIDWSTDGTKTDADLPDAINNCSPAADAEGTNQSDSGAFFRCEVRKNAKANFSLTYSVHYRLGLARHSASGMLNR